MTELDRAGRDELHYAARDNDVAKVRARLAAGVDPNLREWRAQYTPLDSAVQEGAVAAATELLDAGADVNASSAGGGTALHIAVERWHMAPDGSMIQLLLDRGADQNALTGDGGTPASVIDELFQFPDDLARLLLAPYEHSIGTGVPPGLDRSGRDQLHHAAHSNDLDTVHARLAAGVDPNLPQHGPELTPLHFTARFGGPEPATALLDAGADINAAAINGATPLHLAVANWSVTPDGAMIKLLLDHGADQTARTTHGTTPADQIDQLFRFPDELAQLLR